jgi:hypothetical protein
MDKGTGIDMEFVIAALSLAGLVLCVVVLGMAFGYDLVEVTFHPPIFVKIKLNRSRRRWTGKWTHFLAAECNSVVQRHGKVAIADQLQPP